MKIELTINELETILNTLNYCLWYAKEKNKDIWVNRIEQILPKLDEIYENSKDW